MCSGVSKGTIEATEKLDGINICFTVSSHGETLFIRNKNDIRLGGLKVHELLSRYKNHVAEKQLQSGCLAIANFCKEVWWPIGFAKKNWVNCEIISKEGPRLISYDKNAIVIHDILSFNRRGELAESKVHLLPKLLNSFKTESTVVDKETWELIGPTVVSPAGLESDLLKREIYALINLHGLTLESSILDWGIIKTVDYLKSLGFPLDKKIKLAEIIMNAPDKDTLTAVKKGTSKYLAKKMTEVASSKNKGKIKAEILFPLEEAITKFSCALLGSTNSHFIEDFEKEKSRIHRITEDSINLIEQTNDGWRERRRKLIFLYRKKLHGNYPASLEGLVFSWNKKKYKITGYYGPANQIVSLVKNGRKPIPPVVKNAQEVIKDEILIKSISTV
jgi:hypothetical protein